MQIKITSKTIPKNIDELLKVVLSNRGIKDAKDFFHPTAPLELSLKDVGISTAQVKKAVKRILEAKAKQEKIIVFGDYDCDGVCATAVLWETLYGIGCQVLPFIPNRQEHGYGLSAKAIDEILGAGTPAILISVDNGITAKASWKRLNAAGVYTILTDHHEPDATPPQTGAFIHTTKLCGTTVAWMLAREIDRERVKANLDLCALATIADQMPLTDSNRSFAKYGLEQLNVTKRLGLKLLIEAAGLKAGEIASFSVNFGIVPRINAMGRLGQALDALRALCTTNELRARDLVSKLNQTNLNRQELTQELVSLARSRAAEWEGESVIVIEDKLFHEGVIGLIAGKLTEEFHRPSVVISVGETVSKASARSVPGVHITELLREVSEVLLDVGGHPLAAGFRIESSRIADFKTLFGKKAKAEIPPELLIPTREADCELPPELVTQETAAALTELEPYGQGNREPVFVIRGVVLQKARQVGKEGKHLSVQLKLGEDKAVNGVAFGQGERLGALAVGEPVDLLASLDLNTWKGRTSIQLRVRHFL